MSDADVLVVGAGPVGLTAALALVRSGMRVDLVESRPALESESLAATFHPPTLQILADLCLELHCQGLEARTIAYLDAVAGDEIRFELAELAGETAFPYRRHVPQIDVCRLLLAELADDRRCRISFGVTASGGVTGSYPWVFAADGANSGLRSAAGLAFPGTDYAGTVVRLICEPRGFEGWDPVTYVVSGHQSVSVLRLSDHVRVIVRVDAGSTDPESVAVDTANLVLGMSPRLRGWSCYRSQRRVIETNVVDNLIFVGDSAHVTTTRGGMNMNAGIHDAAVIATALARDPAKVEEAAAARLAVARDVLLPRTHETLGNPSARLDRVRALRSDGAARVEFLRAAAMLDMVCWP